MCTNKPAGVLCTRNLRAYNEKQPKGSKKNQQAHCAVLRTTTRQTMLRIDRIRVAQALDNDQEGPTVQHRKLFEEDREFNQGAQPQASGSLWHLSLAGARLRQAAMSPSLPQPWSRA